MAQLNTFECVLSDLLDCGYADLDILDELYDQIGDEIYYSDDRQMLLQNVVANGTGLNGLIRTFYSDIIYAVHNRIVELIEEYESTLDEDGNATEDTEGTDLVQEMYNFFYNLNGGKQYEDRPNEFAPLTDKQLKVIREKVNALDYVEPYANGSDNHFQCDLDQTFNSDESVKANALDLIQYWLDHYVEDEDEEVALREM